MSLYPTKTRLALLREVADGLVERCASGDHWHIMAGVHPRVDARMDEAARAGWIRFVYGKPELTDAGRAVLAQADAKEQT